MPIFFINSNISYVVLIIISFVSTVNDEAVQRFYIYLKKKKKRNDIAVFDILALSRLRFVRLHYYN